MMEKVKRDADGESNERGLSVIRCPYNEADETEAENQPKCFPADTLQGYSINQKEGLRIMSYCAEKR